MNLHTIFNSMAPLVAFKESLFRVWSGDDNHVNEEVFKYSLNHPSSECISINMPYLLEALFDDELKPKNKEVYDQLCTALMANGVMSDLFQYEEIEFENRDAFFEDCTCDDLMAYAALLVTEYMSYAGSNTIINYMALHPRYSGCIYNTPYIKDMMRDYHDHCLDIYPSVLAFVTTDAAITLEELEIIKDILIITKVDNMAVTNRTLANIVCDEISGISKDTIYYYNGKRLNTSNFKDSDLEICRFLYCITRDGFEVNSIPNIKAIFESLKTMVKTVQKNTLDDMFSKFLYNNKDTSPLIVSYMQRLAALNSEALKDKEDLASVTFHYEDRDLFTIVAEKAA